MTEKLFPDLATDARRKTIAAWRYLAFLDLERRYLAAELQPHARKRGLWVPCDRQVDQLITGNEFGPMDRAEDMLRHLGLDPYEEDAWAPFIGIDVTTIPFLGSVK